MLNPSYRPEIDGLRALAIGSVILFHLHAPWLRGGFIGVDIFFVISGFLITGIIDRELAQQSFSILGFYARRIRRILPALLAVVAATLVAQYWIGYQLDCSFVGKQAIATLGSVSNIFFWRQSADYWGVKAEHSPLLHTWSLAIEEQFYLVLPFGLLLLRNRSRLFRALVISLTIVVSLLALGWAVERANVAGFYLLPTRWWELAVGCLLALLVRERPLLHGRPAWAGGLALVGLALILGSAHFLRRLDLTMCGPILGAVLVLAFGQVGPCYWLLTRRPLVHIGKLSYSLYLWHWPILLFAEPYWDELPTWWLILPMYCCAWLSFHGVEQTTRWRSGIVPPILVTAGLLGIAGFLLTFADRGYDTSRFEKPLSSGLAFELNPSRIPHAASEIKFRLSQGYVAPPPLASTTAYREEGLVLGDESKPIQVMVIGDSHGLIWSPTIREIVERHHLRASFCSMGGVSPPWDLQLKASHGNRLVTGQFKYEFDRSRLENLARWRPDVVLLSTPWDGRSQREVSDLIGYCQEHARRVLLIEQPPRVQGIGNRSAIQYACFRRFVPQADKKRYWPVLDRDSWQQGRELIHSLALRFPGCRVVPTADIYESDGKALLIDGLHIVYRDDDHLSDWGAHLAESRLEAFILEAIAEASQEKASQEKSSDEKPSAEKSFQEKLSEEKSSELHRAANEASP